MDHTPDLAAYFDRIGYRGDPQPTLDTLRQLHVLHTEAIPFENLSPFLGEPVELDQPALEDKLIHRGRGGYCYEHNLLFSRMLQALGFEVAGLAARVRLNQPDHVQTPRTHMLLRVRLDEGDYLADVGFGGLTQTAPLKLVPDMEQATPHEPFRLLHADGLYTLQALVAGDWRTLYQFDLQEQQLPDYQLASWYLSHHPQSHFVTGLMLARTEPGLRHALHNNRYTLHHLGGASEKRELASVDELLDVLQTQFRIRLPEIPGMRDKLERLLATEPS
ncbi:arylamine N-acetyltransferase family protein [Pseudomonas indica]|uniref:arylamine N-acetyltransferase family protein n=1 Tax=Pseudomonas indica TaxID=137658 RepID=UPI000BAB9E75|nr:arylamine N-acetyltransferase [Pseudomonas indica]PAU60426.1 arylamine N-acetyltransferase [Pseudomonas indica]